MTFGFIFQQTANHNTGCYIHHRQLEKWHTRNRFPWILVEQAKFASAIISRIREVASPSRSYRTRTIACLVTLFTTGGDGASVGEFQSKTVVAETKINTSNNFTKPLWYDTLVTYEYVTNVSHYYSKSYLSDFGDTCAKLWISYEKQDGRRHRTIDAITKGRRLLQWI